MASTYVNDLRLNELGTGDASGTWGNITNTNLELIGEGLSFTTKDCFASDGDQTETVADGATDPLRGMYVKITSSATLSATRTLTIAPNTVSRLQFIENATTGSQSITISQGTGANVTIPNGDVKAIYLDGAGSGAAVVDAFTDLNLAGTTTLSVVSTSGNITSAGRVIVDDTTEATSTTDGSLQTDGGLSVAKDIVAGDDVKLLSDSSILSLGADEDVTITHDGTTGVTFAGNPITLDSGADIILDADGADIIFKDAGTSIGTFTNSSSDFVIQANVQDKDILFKGDDGGSGITALTLDMSEAGNATFNGTVTGTSATFNGGVVVDNITIDGTEIDLSSGDLVVDVAGNIQLDPDDNGEVRYLDNGTQYFVIKGDSNNAVLQSTISDADLVFRGNDGGSIITALTLDISGAGAATFNNDVTAFSDKRLKTDISNIENGLDKVMKMQGVHYKRNDIEDAKPQIGVLAQDMEAIVPEVVLTADDEMQTKSVDYGKLTAVLIEAIKDLKAEIDELKGR
tara:strand:+ start:1233 stop:2780 length:1548 start_codon:yes stop_codon:yes gene_type:complete